MQWYTKGINLNFFSRFSDATETETTMYKSFESLSLFRCLSVYDR